MASIDPSSKTLTSSLAVANKKDFSNIPPDFLNIPPSRRTFFEYQYSPTAFSDMTSYTSIRNFFYYFGIIYNHKKVVNAQNKVEITEPKVILFDISRMMNIMQEDNGRLSQLSMQGRVIAEAVARFLAPPGGYPPSVKTLEDQISTHIKHAHPSLYLPLSSIDGMVMAWDNYSMEIIQPRQRTAMIDYVYAITSYLASYLKATYPEEAAVALERAAAQSSSSGREIWDSSYEYYLNSDITVWLHEKGLEPLASYFAPFLITSLDELIRLKANYLCKVEDRDPELSTVIDGISSEYKALFDKVILTLEEGDIPVYRALSEKAIAMRCQVEDAEAAMMHEQRDALQQMDGTLTISHKDDHCMFTFTGHTSFVWAVCALEDNSRIVSGSEDGSIKVWDVANGRFVKSLKQHPSYVISLCCLGNGEKIASGSADGVIRIWDIDSGNILKAFKGHEGSIYSIKCLGNDRLVTASVDMFVRIWDLKDGTIVKSLQGHSHSVRSVTVLGAKGDRIASGSDDKTIVVWDVHTGKPIRTLAGHESYIFSVIGIGNGERLASGSGDTLIKIWDVISGKCMKTLRGHTSFVFSLAVLGNYRNRIVSGSTDNTLKIWDISTGDCLKTLMGHSTYVFSVCSLQSGDIVVSGSRDKSVKIWSSRISASGV